MSALTWHFRGRYLGLVESGRWEYATRTNASGVVVLVPLTARGELVLVEQFRVPVGRVVLELPAGLAGDLAENDETLESAAARELLEETGYRAGRLELLMACPSSAGLTDEIIHIYLAQDLQREHSGGGDSSENILVHHLPLADAEAWLQAQAARGLLLDPKIFAALYWLRDTPAAASGSEQP